MNKVLDDSLQLIARELCLERKRERQREREREREGERETHLE